MKSKNIVLLCECRFTRSGLETLLRPEARIFSTASLAQCEPHLLQTQDGEIDLVILSLRHGGMDTLVSLTCLLRHRHPACTVLLDPGVSRISLLRFYLNCLNTQAGVIDFTLPIPTLMQFIRLVMTRQVTPSTWHITGQVRLTARERSVLQAMMGECQAHDIAHTLSLSVKTVSAHKRSGLRKLGARSLQDLLLPASPSALNRLSLLAAPPRATTMTDVPAFPVALTG